MPTYEYSCETCGKSFELQQKMSEPALKKCSKAFCPIRKGRGKIKRLIGAGAGLIFKGSGFYATDYRSNNYKEKIKEEKSNKEKIKEEKSKI